MNIEKEKTSLISLIGRADNETFTNAQVLRGILDEVEPMHNLAVGKVATDGGFAKLYAEQVATSLERIFLLANDRLSDIVEANTNQK